MEPLRRTSGARFGIFEVSFDSGEMRRAGLKIRVQQQPLKLLQILLERPGEVVSREHLRSRLWANESFGDFDQAVNIAIGKLRSALGDAAENPRYIETLPKRGYRFIAEVTIVDFDSRSGGELSDLPESPTRTSASSDLNLSPPDTPVQIAAVTDASKRRWWTKRRIVIATVVGLGLSILVVPLALYWTHRPTGIRSLAVLPLDNFSGDPSQDYFADGMTDELITDLAQIRALRVVSRTSVMMYKGTRKPLTQIARELNVDAVVEGSVLRSGDQVRITAQLIQVPVDKHLWAESYQGNVRDTLAVQNRVARAIAEEIRIEVTPQEQAVLKSAKTIAPEAYEAYLKGRYFWNKRTGDGLKKAVDYFNQALAKDPNYAAAYSGLADTYALLGDWQYAVMPPKETMPKALSAARKALKLDDSLGEAHASLAFCLEGFDWDFATADREFQRAIELNPGYATAHHWYAWHLSLIGRNSEAIAEMKKAENLDPVSPVVSADLAELLLIVHLPDESMQQSRKTIEMNSDFAFAHNQLAQAYIQKQMFGDAIAELREAMRLAGNNPIFVANLARAYAGSKRRAEAESLLNNLKSRSTPTAPLVAEIAMIYTALGDKDQAMVWLEKGYEERINPGVLERPCFDVLRSDPRFQDLWHRIGLPSKYEDFNVVSAPHGAGESS
jgi:TolB-like protein/DNA-binding winged helix-turn-helix (wHTH) protein/Tfp pilus assembly protein PilF